MSDNSLEYTPVNCWERYASAADQEAMDDLAQRYVAFISACKTEREVVEYALNQARGAGFGDDAATGKLVRVFRGKTLFMARKGRRPLSEGFRLVGAHGDSPRLDCKQRPLYEDCQVSQAKTHYYGGLRKHQWLSRPLALHGVVVKTDGQVVRVCIGEDAGDPVFAVPDLLPHLAQEQNEKKLAKAFEAEKMNILFGHQPLRQEKADTDDKDQNGGAQEAGNNGAKNPIKRHVLELLHAKYGIVEEDLYSAELQAVPAGPARFVGLDRACIGGYGQDDRICVFAGLEAMLGGEEAPEHTQMFMIWDKEEIGSDGSTGAKSMFFEYCVNEVLQAWEPGTRREQAMLAAKALSADVHGALDPDYQELHEKLNAALLGHGPVFCKFTGSRGKYSANDAHPEYVAWLRGLLAAAGVPWQMAELGKVDHGGGGTVAKYLAVYGMDVIDFGPALLSMHSPFEISSKVDLYATVKAFAAFFAS